MREPQQLERFYHRHRIVSIQQMEPDQPGDGYTHAVYDENNIFAGAFETLGKAIRCAKCKAYPGKYPEEIESTETLEPVGVDSDGSIKPIKEILPLPEETETELPEIEERE